MTTHTKFWTVKAATEKSSAELLLYGPISSTSWWDDEVTPKQFANDLQSLGDIDELIVRINSGGGDVFAGQAIYSMIKSHKANVTVYVDGLAASIASVIAMAGDKIIMPRNAMIMIHNPWSYGRGNANDLRELADFLDKVRETLLAAYESKTGMNREELIALLDAETWMTAEEAKEKGFIDEIDYENSVSASMHDNNLVMNGVTFSVNKFKNLPRIVAQTHSKPREEVKNMELTVEKIKNEYPDLYKAIKDSGYQDGVKAERDRIKALEDISAEGCEEIIAKAKFETGQTANDIAMDIINILKNSVPKSQPSSNLEALNRDAAVLNDVKQAEPAGKKEKEEQEINDLASIMAGAANTKRGVK